jgi:hypothetical protein
MGAVETLAGVATCGGGGVGGLEVHMNLIPPGVSKVSFFSIFWTFWAAWYGRCKSLPNSNFGFLVMKKDTYNDIFARRFLKRK